MDILLKAIPIAIPVILVILIFLMGYVKAPPDVAYIISGLRKHPKVLIGKAGIKIPFLERVDKLIVRQISIDIKSEGYIPTQDFIGVDVDAVAKVRVMTDPEGIQLAMKNFLNMTEDDFNRAIVDSLQGNMREIIGTITLKEICNDRKKFGDEVQSKAQTDMNALGIQIISCNIQRVTDENSLINSLGQDNMSKIQKDAAIDALHGGVPQRQFAAVFHHDADAAEDLHIHQGQITAVGDIQGLGNVAGFHIVPRNIIAQNAVGAAFMGTVPNLQFLRHANAVFFTVHIAAEVFNGPRLHDIPCVEAALILFQIFDFDLVYQRFLTGVDAEGQGITIRGAALIVLNMNGYQITARVLRRTIQRQVTAESHVDAFHAAVSIGFRSIRSARYDVDEALAAIQTDFRMMIQESGSKAACRGGSINF